MKEVVAEPRIESLTVTIPPARENIGRMIGVICGLSLAGIGVIMMISIVLFIPGIFGVLIGLVTTVLSTPKTSAICPACSTENKVALKAKQLKCEGCETTTPLKWKKPQRN